MFKKKPIIHTYRTRTFEATVVWDINTGKKRIKLVHDTYYQHEINKFPVGQKLTLYLTDKRPKRSEAQNRYYWGVYLPQIAAETGNDIDDLHILFKGKFLSKQIIEVLGEKVRKAKSTTELSVVDFMDYIKRIEEFTGVLAPPPVDLELAPLKDNK